MTDYPKRPEITIETMGKVNNPSGLGLNVVSSDGKKYISGMVNKSGSISSTSLKLIVHQGVSDEKTLIYHDHDQHSVDGHETMVKEAGSSRRNITRKKGEGSSHLYNSKNKKQGGAGKGKWSNLRDGSDMSDIPIILDKNDPLYDDLATEGRYFLSSLNGGNDKEDEANGYDLVDDPIVYGPILALSEFKIRVSISIMEYFDSADADEVVRSIQEMRCKLFHPEVVKRAISLSLDKGPRERELISRLLTCLHPYPLTDSEMVSGFEIILDSSDDLCIDIPDAKGIVGCFLARAIVDEVLPPAFISNRSSSHPGYEVVEKSVNLLSREHCTARLEKVWGPGDGRPVVELKEVIDQLVEEYLLSRELDEAARCIREMNAPHFHHELLKRSVKIAMEKDGLDHAEISTSSLDAIAALFSFLVKNAIVSEYQVSKGISRLYKILPDLKLDVPAAPAMLDEFEAMAQEGGCLISSPYNICT